MPLIFMKPGKTHMIRKISGPPALKQRLGELGFVTGSPVTVVGGLGGDLILQVKGCRIALGCGMARHIHV
jgi:ferrous iron transport protein A